MPCCGNMTSARTVDDLGYALAMRTHQLEGGLVARPNILPL
jgi:hypothetical protein